MKKKVMAIMLASALVLATIVAAMPAGADKKNLYQADLVDNTMPDYAAVLYSGSVTVDQQSIAEVEISTNATCQTYNVRMEIGGGIYRYGIALGTITTNDKGKGEALFDLKDYARATPLAIAPHFIIYTPAKAFPEFDTSIAVPGWTPPALGKIVVGMSCSSNVSQYFAVDVSFAGYPNGAALRDGQTINSGFSLTPGIYTVTEYFLPRYNLSNISFNDPSGGSMRSGRTAIVNVAPGETVFITFSNAPAP